MTIKPVILYTYNDQVQFVTYRFNIYGIHLFKFLQMTRNIRVKYTANEAVYLHKVRQDCIDKKDIVSANEKTKRDLGHDQQVPVA